MNSDTLTLTLSVERLDHDQRRLMWRDADWRPELTEDDRLDGTGPRRHEVTVTVAPRTLGSQRRSVVVTDGPAVVARGSLWNTGSLDLATFGTLAGTRDQLRDILHQALRRCAIAA